MLPDVIQGMTTEQQHYKATTYGVNCPVEQHLREKFPEAEIDYSGFKGFFISGTLFNLNTVAADLIRKRSYAHIKPHGSAPFWFRLTKAN